MSTHGRPSRCSDTPTACTHGDRGRCSCRARACCGTCRRKAGAVRRQQQKAGAHLLHVALVDAVHGELVEHADLGQHLRSGAPGAGRAGRLLDQQLLDQQLLLLLGAARQRSRRQRRRRAAAPPHLHARALLLAAAGQEAADVGLRGAVVVRRVQRGDARLHEAADVLHRGLAVGAVALRVAPAPGGGRRAAFMGRPGRGGWAVSGTGCHRPRLVQGQARTCARRTAASSP